MDSHITGADSLQAHLDHVPQVLKFGTSGRRGEVVHLTQLEVYVNALAELEYLQSLAAADGGIRKGDAFYFASDLRPSSSRYVAEQGGRGEIAQAIVQAIADAGMRPVNCGRIPTPALAAYAIAQGRGSMMVTGSHIPFDRNGYKTNSAKGELLKKDEGPINARVEQVRARAYGGAFSASHFGRDGLFKGGSRALPPEDVRAGEAYVRRYTEFFGGRSLAGKRLVAYQHSAVGRDMLVEILRRLGAEVIPVGRSETFVPIDTENIEREQLEAIQRLTEEAWRGHGPVDAVVSTDGDSDRPLLLGVEATGDGAGGPCRVKFFGGDLVGMVVAEYLGADAVVVPITCNDGIDRGRLAGMLEPKTRVGSPFVIAGMEAARAKGRKAVVGWEANGGFLTGSDVVKDGRGLAALPTRDALLPLLGVLFSAAERGVAVSRLFAELPQRFSRAALLKNFPRPVAVRLIEKFSSPDAAVNEVVFEGNRVRVTDRAGKELAADEGRDRGLEGVRRSLGEFFTRAGGFGGIEKVSYTDGLRVYFENGDVAHVRPSGNADELRIYAVADTQERADAIARAGTAEPDGILRRIERAVRG